MKQLLLFAFIILCYIVAAGTAVYYHEQAHYVIAYNHGCVNGEITYSFTSYSKFECKGYVGQTPELNMQERNLQSLTEISGYQQQAWILFGFVLFTLWYALKGE